MADQIGSSTLLQVGIPIIGGIAAAATPGIGRGVGAASGLLNQVSAAKDIYDERQDEKQFGQRLKALLEPSGGEPAPGQMGPPSPTIGDRIDPTTRRLLAESIDRRGGPKATLPAIFGAIAPPKAEDFTLGTTRYRMQGGQATPIASEPKYQDAGGRIVQVGGGRPPEVAYEPPEARFKGPQAQANLAKTVQDVEGGVVEQETKQLALQRQKKLELVQEKLIGLDTEDPKNKGQARALLRQYITFGGSGGKDLLEELDRQDPLVVANQVSQLLTQQGVTGLTPSVRVDERGRSSVSLTREPMSETRTMAKAAEEKFPGDPVKQGEWLQQQRVAQAAAQGRASAEATRGASPLEAGERAAIVGLQGGLSMVSQLKTFSRDELEAFTGAIKRPLKEAEQFLRGTFGDGADARYSSFRTVLGQLGKNFFEQAGAALTAAERAILEQYIPTGYERGGAVELVQKARYFEAGLQASLNLRAMLAKTGRASVDPAEFEQLYRQELQRQGVPVPSQGAQFPDMGPRPSGPVPAGPAAAPRSDSFAPRPELQADIDRADAMARKRFGKPYIDLDAATRRNIWDHVTGGR